MRGICVGFLATLIASASGFSQSQETFEAPLPVLEGVVRWDDFGSEPTLSRQSLVLFDDAGSLTGTAASISQGLPDELIDQLYSGADPSEWMNSASGILAPAESPDYAGTLSVVDDAVPLTDQAESEDVCAGPLSDGYAIFGSEVTAAQAANMNVGFGSSAGEGSSIYRVFYVSWYRDIRDDTADPFDNNAVILGRCGVGVRVLVRQEKQDATVGVGLAAIAARGTLSNARSEIFMRTFGMSGPAVNAAMPELSELQNFDTEAYGALRVALDRLAAAMAAGGDDISLQPVPITTAQGAAPNQFTEALSVYWALVSITESKSCRDAMRSFPGDGGESASRDVIASIYQSVVGSCRERQRVRSDDVAEASRLLAAYGT